jgi:hypothetical protein
MKIKIKYHKHAKRTQRAIDLSLRMAADFNAGMSAKDIARRYTNPYTKKPYTREHVYLVLKRLQKRPLTRFVQVKQNKAVN